MKLVSSVLKFKPFGASYTAEEDDVLLLQLMGSQRDSAYLAIMQKYGALVWSISKRQHLSEADAEDVFQATFLVLLAHAKSIRHHSLSSWLYGVTWRIGSKLKRQLSRERKRLERVALQPTHDQIAEMEYEPDGLELLKAEIQRLPGIYRDPIIHCCLLGESQSTTAQVLGWPLGTVAGRLARAKELLRRRLVKKGIAFCSFTALTAELNAVPHTLIQHARDVLTSPLNTKVQIMTRSFTGWSILSKLSITTVALLFLLVTSSWLALGQTTPQVQQAVKDPSSPISDESSDRAALQGVWVRDIYHDVTGLVMGQEELIFREQNYELRIHVAENLDGKTVQSKLVQWVRMQPFQITAIQNQRKRIELVNFGFDANRGVDANTPNQSAAVTEKMAQRAERYLGEYEINKDTLVITFQKKLVYKVVENGKVDVDRDNPRPLTSTGEGKRVIYQRSVPKPSLDLVMAKLKENEVAYRFMVTELEFQRLMEGDIVNLHARKKREGKQEEIAFVLMEQVEVIGKEPTIYRESDKRSILLRVTKPQALIIKSYEVQNVVSLVRRKIGDK